MRTQYFNHRFKMSVYVTGLLLLTLLSSCQDFFISEVNNVTIPGSEPQLVVNSYISPQDTVIRVWVYRSRPYTQPPSEFILVRGNANVQMRAKGGEFVVLPYDYERGYFSVKTSELPIIEGQYYELTVTTPEGDNVNAECFVPDFEIADLSVTAPRLQTDNSGFPYRLLDWRITGLNDNKERFYRTGGYSRSYMLYNNQSGGVDTSSVDIQNIWMNRGNPFFRDQGNSTQHRFSGELYSDIYFYYDPSTGEPYDPGYFEFRKIDSIFITVIQSDIHYFLFHTSIDNYFIYGDDFPFAEPVHIYNNIKGGLGTFGGYNRKTWWVHTDILP